MATPINKQPVNLLAPWGVQTDDGEHVGVRDGGLYATSAQIGKLYFSDGSVMTTASGGSLPSDIDAGTF